jgi:hypothetical protein
MTHQVLANGTLERVVEACCAATRAGGRHWCAVVLVSSGSGLLQVFDAAGAPWMSQGGEGPAQARRNGPQQGCSKVQKQKGHTANYTVCVACCSGPVLTIIKVVPLHGRRGRCSGSQTCDKNSADLTATVAAI